MKQLPYWDWLLWFLPTLDIDPHTLFRHALAASAKPQNFKRRFLPPALQFPTARTWSRTLQARVYSLSQGVIPT